jgi:hypothetical protein
MMEEILSRGLRSWNDTGLHFRWLLWLSRGFVMIVLFENSGRNSVVQSGHQGSVIQRFTQLSLGFFERAVCV